MGVGSTVFRTAKYTSHEVFVDDEQLVNPLDPLKLTRTFSQDSQKADLRY